MEEYKRLHITPLTPSLLNSILPSSVQANACNISYHTIQTFPEKSYGYVELPLPDTERIKNKLNGCIIKGVKLRIQMARPAVVRGLEPTLPQTERPARRSKKRMRDELPGVEIGERRVKRGWTTPVQELKRAAVDVEKPVAKSKYTSEPECLFKTVLPANVASNSKASGSKSSKKKKKGGKETIVHEFANATKYPTFLRDNSVSNNSKVVTEFIEGVGWVDEHGNLVEEVRRSRKSLDYTLKAQKDQDPRPRFESTVEKESDLMEKGTKKSLTQVTKTDAGKVSDTKSLSTLSSPLESGDSESEASEHGIMSTKRPVSSKEISAQSLESSSYKSDASHTSPGAKKGPKIRRSKLLSEFRLSDANKSFDQVKLDTSISETQANENNPDESSDATSSSPSSPSFSSSSESEDSHVGPEKVSTNSTNVQVPSIKNSSSSSLDNPCSDTEDERAEPDEPPKFAFSTPPPTSTNASLSIQIPSVFSQHPLEALFKKSEPQIHRLYSPEFKFFASDTEDADYGGESELRTGSDIGIPLTPFTKREIEHRIIRSAAPTPDTAHVNKRFIWPQGNEADTLDEEGDPKQLNQTGKDTRAVKQRHVTVSTLSSTPSSQNEFQKLFWENRGTLNRAWKKRRKIVLKERRQGDNCKR